MQASQTPTLVPLAFAANGTKNAIPEASQISVTPGAASLNDGFPPLTFTPIAAGGVPPAGADFNGVLNLITQSIRWAHGGGRYPFSSTFAADANVSGYPAGAELMSADQQGAWLSLNDANTDNPDTGAGTKWVPSRSYGITAITGLTNANITLTPAQAAKDRITLAGTLTGNVQIVFPAWVKDWYVANNTTGNFTVTCKTASGAGVAIPQNGYRTKIVGNGTDILQLAENIANAAQAQQPATLGQVQAYGGGFGGITQVSSTISLTNGVSGQLVVMGASAAPTLPDVSTMTIGQSVTFTNQDSVAHTITAFGAQTIVTSGVAVPSLILQPGQDIVLTARSSSTWSMASGSGKFQFNGMAAGRFLGVQRFTGSGTYNSTSGATKIVVELWGGGGGGAGCPSTGAGQSAVAGGGGGGAYLKTLITSGFSGGVPITIGAGGTGGPAGLNSGGSGGTTTFGAIASAAGGSGSSSTPAGTPPLIGGAGGSGVATSTTGTTLDVTIGAAGGPAFAQAVGASLGGSGGGSGGHYGPVGAAAGAPGISGASAGVGGSGGSQGASGGALAGGSGSAGQIIVWEYS
jgi:plastocyanin